MLHFVFYLLALAFFCWVIHVRGSIFCGSCFKLLIDLWLWVLHYYMSLLFVFEIKIFIFLYLYFFPHMRFCILFKCFRKYTGWFIWAAFYFFNWWIVVRLNLCFWALFCKWLLLVNFELFKLCFVTDCQRGSLLGSKDLGFMYLES